MTPVKLYVFGVPEIQAFHSWCNGLPFPCVFLLRSPKSLFYCSEGSPPASSSHWKLAALKARRPSSTLFHVKTATVHWLRTHAHFSGTAHSLSMWARRWAGGLTFKVPYLDLDDKILTKQRKLDLLTCMCYTTWAKSQEWMTARQRLVIILLWFTEPPQEGMILFLEKKQDKGNRLLSLCVVR